MLNYKYLGYEDSAGYSPLTCDVGTSTDDLYIEALAALEREGGGKVELYKNAYFIFHKYKIIQKF